MAVQSTNGENLWTLLEADGLFVDDDLKLILKAAKSDNLLMLSTFGKDDKLKIETFMSQTLHKLISKESYEKYYGIFKDKPELFRLVAGHEKQIDLISKVCRKNISAQNLAAKTPTNMEQSSSSQGSALTQQKPGVSSVISSSSGLGDEEKKILYQKDRLDKNINQHLADNYEETLKVSCIVAEDGLGSYIAKLKCPVCDKSQKITKTGSRWSTSNLYVHLKTHVEKDSSAKVRKIDTMFCLESNKSQKKSTSLTPRTGPGKRKSRDTQNVETDEAEDDPVITIAEESSETIDETTDGTSEETASALTLGKNPEEIESIEGASF